MSMKKYFIEKLTGIMRNIDLVERDIIQAATEMDVKKLQKATQSLAEENMEGSSKRDSMSAHSRVRLQV